MIFQTILKIFSMTILLSLGLEPLYGLGQIVNRGLFEIDGFAYTQRDMLVYKLAEHGLFSVDLPYRVPNDTGEWLAELDRYVTFMRVDRLIQSDTQRYSMFLPNEDMTAKGVELIYKAIAQNPSLSMQNEKFSIEKPELEEATLIVLRVQRFLKSKILGPTESNGFVSVDTSASWFANILSSQRFRFYDNARKYVTIGSKEQLSGSLK